MFMDSGGNYIRTYVDEDGSPCITIEQWGGGKNDQIASIWLCNDVLYGVAQLDEIISALQEMKAELLVRGAREFKGTE